MEITATCAVGENDPVRSDNSPVVSWISRGELTAGGDGPVPLTIVVHMAQRGCFRCKFSLSSLVG